MTGRRGTVPPLAGGTVQLWWARAEAAHPGHAALLGEAERRRLTGMRHDADRARFTVGAALVRLIGAAALGVHPRAVPVDRHCDVCRRPHGPPRIPASGLCLSVSHAAGRVVVAAARGTAVGVDVESVRGAPETAGMVRHVLSSAERATVPARPLSARALVATWSRKEAVLKALGVGLRVPMARLVVSGPGEPARLLRYDPDPAVVARTRLLDLHTGRRYTAALAVLDAGVHPRLVQLDGGRLLAAHPVPG